MTHRGRLILGRRKTGIRFHRTMQHKYYSQASSQGPLCVLEGLHHVCTVCGYHTPAASRHETKPPSSMFSTDFLLQTWPPSLPWHTQKQGRPLVVLHGRSSQFVPSYPDVSARSHCHRCPDTSGDERTFCRGLEVKWRVNNVKEKEKHKHLMNLESRFHQSLGLFPIWISGASAMEKVFISRCQSGFYL